MKNFSHFSSLNSCFLVGVLRLRHGLDVSLNLSCFCLGLDYTSGSPGLCNISPSVENSVLWLIYCEMMGETTHRNSIMKLNTFLPMHQKLSNYVCMSKSETT